MDPAKELTQEKALHPSTPRAAEANAGQRLDEIARELSAAGSDLRRLGELTLEGLLDLLGFERGFLVVVRRSPSAPQPGDDFQVLATRAAISATPSKPWSSVRNPEFAVNRVLLKRALSQRDPVMLNDCLMQSGSHEGQHRAVICQAFDLAPGAVGVLSLDRPLGGRELGNAERETLRHFRERCLVFLLREFAFHECEALAAKLRDASAPRAASGAEGSENDADDDDGAEGPVVDPETSPSFHGIVGKDEKLQRIFKIVEKIKDSDLSVCIFGESGTGKELLARSIHDAGVRREKPFLAENCGAIPENLLESELFGHTKGSFTGADEDKQGLFESANGGTLFLDEIGDMSEGMQRKLLRVLQEGVIRPIGAKSTAKVDVRVICASNRDLKVLVQKGTFRADLYYRLNVITIEVPPLRERPGDIPALVRHVAANICEEEGTKRRFSQSAMKALAEYPWPGNIRELRNVLRRVIVTSARRVVTRKDVIVYLSNLTASPRSGENIDRDDKDLVIRVPARDSFNDIIDECERVVLLNALKQCAWNKSRVTKALKIPRQSLYNKIAKYRLERDWGAELARADESEDS